MSGLISKPPAQASAATIEKWSHVATWGDSLTFGSGSTLQADYPTIFAGLSGYTVYNGGVGGETSTQVKARMLAATDKHAWPTIIWAGRNNYTDTATVISDVAAMVAALGHTNYLVISVLNGEFGSTEYVGGSGYNNIATINASLSTTYGAHYVDVRSYLISLYNSNDAQDVIDHGHDIPPSSLRSDTIHLNDDGYAAAAAKIYESVAQLQHGATTFLTNKNLTNLFGSPPTFGQVDPATIYASRVLYSGGSQTAPSIAGTGTSSKTGIYWPGGTSFYTVSNGSAIFNFSLNFQGLTTGGAFIPGGVGTSSTLPTLCPSNQATTTGLGAFASGGLSLITSATERLRVDASGDVRAMGATKIGIGGASGPTWSSGTGSPESVVTAPVGSLYTRTDGGAGSTLYVKESGSGSTGWSAK